MSLDYWPLFPAHAQCLKLSHGPDSAIVSMYNQGRDLVEIIQLWVIGDVQSVDISDISTNYY